MGARVYEIFLHGELNNLGPSEEFAILFAIVKAPCVQPTLAPAAALRFGVKFLPNLPRRRGTRAKSRNDFMRAGWSIVSTFNGRISIFHQRLESVPHSLSFKRFRNSYGRNSSKPSDRETGSRRRFAIRIV